MFGSEKWPFLAAVRLRNAEVVSDCPPRSRRLEGEQCHRPFCVNQMFHLSSASSFESFRSIHDAPGGDQSVLSLSVSLG